MANSVKIVRKRCEKCGRISRVSPRARHCYKPGPMGLRIGYVCYGRLVAVARTGTGSAKRRPQDVAAEKADHAMQQAVTIRRRIRRLITAERRWARLHAKYDKRARMTDEEIAAERAAAQQRKDARALQRRRRAVAVGDAI